MTQNGDENAKIQIGEFFYGHIHFQHYQIYQKRGERKRSMQPVNILGGLINTISEYNNPDQGTFCKTYGGAQKR